jgi:hypothetical protein
MLYSGCSDVGGKGTKNCEDLSIDAVKSVISSQRTEVLGAAAVRSGVAMERQESPRGAAEEVAEVARGMRRGSDGSAIGAEAFHSPISEIVRSRRRRLTTVRRQRASLFGSRCTVKSHHLHHSLTVPPRGRGLSAKRA